LRVPSFQLALNLRRLAIARLDINDQHGYPGFEDMVAPQGKVNGVKYEGSYELVATAIMRNRSPALTLAKSRHWPGLTRLEKFAREHCDISKPGDVIEAVCDDASSYRLVIEGAAWKPLRAILEALVVALRQMRVPFVQCLELPMPPPASTASTSPAHHHAPSASSSLPGI